jgi:hypothetical protein
MHRYEAPVDPSAEEHIDWIRVFVQPFDVLSYVDGCKLLRI